MSRKENIGGTSGGRLAFFDILAGDLQPIHFPVPWAADDTTSFLATPQDTRPIVERAGFRVRVWEDATADALRFYEGLSQPAAPSPLGLQLLIADLATKGANLRRNVEEGRIAIRPLCRRR